MSVPGWWNDEEVNVVGTSRWIWKGRRQGGDEIQQKYFKTWRIIVLILKESSRLLI